MGCNRIWYFLLVKRCLCNRNGCKYHKLEVWQHLEWNEQRPNDMSRSEYKNAVLNNTQVPFFDHLYRFLCMFYVSIKLGMQCGISCWRRKGKWKVEVNSDRWHSQWLGAVEVVLIISCDLLSTVFNLEIISTLSYISANSANPLIRNAYVLLDPQRWWIFSP